MCTDLLHHGAVMDGVHNDTSAWQAAVDDAPCQADHGPLKQDPRRRGDGADPDEGDEDQRPA